MKNSKLLIGAMMLLTINLHAQDIIPFDTSKWDINATAYILENYKGKNAIYLQGGNAAVRGETFLNGTVEFDIFLTERPGFPGITFRFNENNGEQFYLRPHQSGNPDANQALPIVNGIAGWQLYFGETYSFVYDYNFDDWTHVKLVVNGDKAQVFLDYSEEPNLSWIMKHPPKEGKIGIGGGAAPMHYANFSIDPTATTLKNFKIIEKTPVEGAVREWSVSDKFEETQLDNLDGIQDLIDGRKWETLTIDESSAANLSWVNARYGTPGNTVFAKLNIKSDSEQVKIFEFGYSDRVVAILNGQPIYWGNNRWRSRDYRYLGTMGLFDAVYLNLKKGDNELVFAVSEDFGGWGIMGRFKDDNGLKVSN